MCLKNVEEVSIEKVEAWKIFHFSGSQLESAFNSSRMYIPYTENVIEYRDIIKNGLVRQYTLNQKIHVIPQSATFFAFEKFEDACYVVKQGRNHWNFASDSLVVLPVILHDVVKKGYLDDCGESFPSFESKEIVVCDVSDTRKGICHTLSEGENELFQKAYGFQLPVMEEEEEE